MRLLFTESASRQFSRLDKKAQQRIVRKLEFYISQTDPLVFAEALADPRFGKWRFRIGDYRIIFDVQENCLTVLAVGHRKDIYR